MDEDKNLFLDLGRFLQNYERIVRLIGESFPEAGIEILVHDLKTRRLQNQDKLNYELNIGARKFKCTTIPIYREKLGLVGAVSINVDYHYLDELVRNDSEKRDLFLDALLRTDMMLDENILSKDEYGKAKKGKRHFRDFSYSPA